MSERRERTDKPRVAVLGAGPTGLEAALAAADHGYPFTLYEASPRVAGSIRDWGHVRLFSPWSLDVSPRMRRHLEAGGHSPPSDDTEYPDGDDLCDRVFEPLAALPELAPNLRTGVRVIEIGRRGLVKSDEIGTGRRAENPFRLLLADGDGREETAEAEVVIDCTGTWRQPNALGDGGIPAPGERSLGPERLWRKIPDLDGEARGWAGKRILLVGAGHSAQTAVRDLAELAERAPGTEVVWAIRSPEPTWKVDPEDPLPRRSELTDRARRLSEGASPAVEAILGVVVESVTPTPAGEPFEVTLRRRDGDLIRVSVDRILALTGSVGDHRIYRQLQVHECYATSGPMNLAAALLGADSDDCLTQETHGADTLLNPEPGFFIVGSKSYGRNNTFLMRVGWQQVEEVFELVARSADR